MNEEEIIKIKEENERIKKEFIEEQTYKDFYKELTEKWETLAKSISERNKSLKKEIEELKEKEKNLLEQLKDSEKELLEVTQNVVNKDRIKELIFYINKDIEIRDFKRMHMQHTTTDSYEVKYSARGVKEMLKNLLEE